MRIASRTLSNNETSSPSPTLVHQVILITIMLIGTAIFLNACPSVRGLLKLVDYYGLDFNSGSAAILSGTPTVALWTAL